MMGSAKKIFDSNVLCWFWVMTGWDKYTKNEGTEKGNLILRDLCVYWDEWLGSFLNKVERVRGRGFIVMIVRGGLVSWVQRTTSYL